MGRPIIDVQGQIVGGQIWSKFEHIQDIMHVLITYQFKKNQIIATENQRTNGPVNAHLISWPTKAQNIQNRENIW